jgi:hypothetical protein
MLELVGFIKRTGCIVLFLFLTLSVLDWVVFVYTRFLFQLDGISYVSKGHRPLNNARNAVITQQVIYGSYDKWRLLGNVLGTLLT